MVYVIATLIAFGIFAWMAFIAWSASKALDLSREHRYRLSLLAALPAVFTFIPMFIGFIAAIAEAMQSGGA
ncbi:hypothetical protein Tam1G_1958 [Bifidobacterium imperatoris]|nr:hypothetical protein Tam1G_1958 [Bifidobacterium imperatoris]